MDDPPLRLDVYVNYPGHCEDAGPANAIVFSSGVGDGRYPTCVGRDAAGRPVRVVTDFLLLDPPPPQPPPPRRPWWRFWR